MWCASVQRVLNFKGFEKSGFVFSREITDEFENQMRIRLRFVRPKRESGPKRGKNSVVMENSPVFEIFYQKNNGLTAAFRKWNYKI
jgi:hypothetical protein